MLIKCLSSVKWYKKYRERQKYYPLTNNDPIVMNVYSQFSTPYRLATHYLDELCVPHDNLTLSGNLAESIVVKHKQTAWTCSLLLMWSGIILFHMDNIKIPLPPIAKVPSFLNHLVRTILVDPDARV